MDKPIFDGLLHTGKPDLEALYRHDDSRDLDADVWETIVRTVLEEADGLVLWGGWKVTAPAGPLPWDENALWWVTIKARLTDKRRTG